GISPASDASVDFTRMANRIASASLDLRCRCFRWTVGQPEMVGAIAGPVARTNRLVSAGRSAPRARSLGIEVHVEPRRLDRVDPPSFGEAVADLLFGDAPRSPVARFLLAEAKHEVAA